MEGKGRKEERIRNEKGWKKLSSLSLRHSYFFLDRTHAQIFEEKDAQIRKVFITQNKQRHARKEKGRKDQETRKDGRNGRPVNLRHSNDFLDRTHAQMCEEKDAQIGKSERKGTRKTNKKSTRKMEADAVASLRRASFSSTD